MALIWLIILAASLSWLDCLHTSHSLQCPSLQYYLEVSYLKDKCAAAFEFNLTCIWLCTKKGYCIFRTIVIIWPPALSIIMPVWFSYTELFSVTWFLLISDVIRPLDPGNSLSDQSSVTQASQINCTFFCLPWNG